MFERTERSAFFPRIRLRTDGLLPGEKYRTVSVPADLRWLNGYIARNKSGNLIFIFSAQQLTIDLLETLTKTTVITYDQLKTGMFRLFDDMEDIQLDVPNVYEQLQTLTKQLEEKKILNPDIISNVPQKGRKRLISGDETQKQVK